MNDRDKTLTPEESRKLFVCDAFRWEAAQHGRGYQNNTDSRVYQALVDRPHHWHPEAKVLFTEPYADPRASSKSCNSLAEPCLSSHAWHRNTS
ncbi:hypothetical protein SAMN05877831_11617 [Rhodobacter maris]|uniref:Uncharacterized protein n=1 Tax=Rhodobacter maris TaxID=446682 RepID=A0A285T9A6_9RHOB|nr:hypothetical protein SAMN05877831_11617 [Rhodobacter maris]